MSTEAKAPSAPITSLFPPSAGSTWRTGLTSLGVALLANLVVLAVARLAGADLLVQRSETATAMTVGVGSVAVMTGGPMLLATLLLLPLRRWGARAWHALAIAGLVVGLVTVPAPFTMHAEGGTRVALALMHVIAGAVWYIVVGHAAAPRVKA